MDDELRKGATKRPFPSCFEPHYESETKNKVLIMKISFIHMQTKPTFI